jgi:MerR family redox-sensitive transcriptional activator SoxR
VLRRIAFIVFAQRVGLTLEEIAAELAKLPSDRIPARQDWAHLVRLQMVWDNLSCLGTEALAHWG